MREHNCQQPNTKSADFSILGGQGFSTCFRQPFNNKFPIIFQVIRLRVYNIKELIILEKPIILNFVMDAPLKTENFQALKEVFQRVASRYKLWGGRKQIRGVEMILPSFLFEIICLT